jgi:xanthine dehydrogenase YagR molybdenum-binding subunit
MYTLAAQVAADALGLSADEVVVHLGDSDHPASAVSGGSMLAASLAPVVHLAAAAVRDELIGLAIAGGDSPLHGRLAGELAAGGGRVYLRSDPAVAVSFAELLSAAGRDAVEVVHDTTHASAKGLGLEAFSTLKALRMPDAGTHSSHAWCAVFAEVKVDEDLGTIRVTRLVGAFDCGRVLNPTTARSQLLGGMVMGYGAACLEGSVVDPRMGRLVNPNFAEYMLPVNADIPEIEVLFVGEPDPYTNALGSKGIGELGVTGVAGAIANAVYHATGRRIRDLPILMEKLL